MGLVVLCSLTTAAKSQESRWPAIEPRFKPIATEVTARYSAPVDNLSGGIAWGTSYEMDAFLEMYLATKDASYLDDFVRLADAVVQARADVHHEIDWEGKSPKGWLTGGHYTLGKPFVLLDAQGKPSLEIQTVCHGANDATKIEVTPASDGQTFTLAYTNPIRKIALADRTVAGLTLQNVEEKLNVPPGKEGYVKVKVLGTQIPRAYPAFTPEVGLVALHGHHTGRVVSPLAQFAAIVQKQPQLKRYAPKAKTYLKCAEEAMTEAESCWHEAGNVGYFSFQKGIPFWSDGVPEPLNVQAASGSAYLSLYDATGKARYLTHAKKLAQLIKDNCEPQPDGTFLYHYWFGLVRKGWTPEDKVSLNTPAFPGQQGIEDLSHFQLSMRFIVESYLKGLVFTRQDLQTWASTFHKKMYQPAPDGGVGTLADNVAGDRKKAPGTYDYSAWGLAMLDVVDPTVPQTLRAMYESKFAPLTTRPVTLYSWAVLARVEAMKKGALQKTAQTLP